MLYMHLHALYAFTCVYMLKCVMQFEQEKLFKTQIYYTKGQNFFGRGLFFLIFDTIKVQLRKDGKKMKKEKVKMMRVSKMKGDLKKSTFEKILKGYEIFSKVDRFIFGYIKNEKDLIVYDIPKKEFYTVIKELAYLNNASDSYKTLNIKFRTVSDSRMKLLQSYYIDTFNIKDLEQFQGNRGEKFEALIEKVYSLKHNKKDAIQNGGIDSKGADGTTYQMKLQAATMQMHREWYENNPLFIENGWV